jgi:hypothetical protein
MLCTQTLKLKLLKEVKKVLKTKAKKFSHKLLALFMAVLMALTCFSGVITAYGQSVQGRYDDDVEYNSLGWSVLSDEQVATAALDLADSYLPQLAALEESLATMVNGRDGYTTLYNVGGGISVRATWDLANRTVSIQLKTGISLSNLATFTVKLGSVDELLETLQSVDAFLSDSGLVQTLLGYVDLGIITDLNLSSIRSMNRSNTSSCDIIRGVLGILYNNNDLVFGRLLRGELSLGVIPVDVYSIVGNLLGVSSDDAKANFAYNILKSVVMNYTEWFTDEELLAYNGGGTLTTANGDVTVAAKDFVFDDVLLEKMTTELLNKISVLVTYNDGTSSATRKEAIQAKAEAEGISEAKAAADLGYDPNLVYSTDKGMENNILLFSYGSDRIQLTADDSLFSFGYKALEFAWKTVLKDTISLVHVNYDADRGHGTNFDNVYYYWAVENIPGGWDTTNLEKMYSYVDQWAEATYKEYEASSVEEFLGWVEHDLEQDRTVADDAVGNWSDIDATTLFNKLRYSPLADYYFDMQTGPINLYFVQTGLTNLMNFFENSYSSYSSLVAGLNDCLVAAVKDIFVDSDNIYVNTVGDTSVPEMTLTNNFKTIDDDAAITISSTLVSNALKMVQYVADTTDQNILNGFYKNGGSVLSEDNLEEAMIPLLIACVSQVNLGSKLSETIHPEDWNACKDAEGVAYVCLKEYLSYILPSKDYSVLVSKDSNGYYVASLEGTILPMARDAVTYVMQGYVPVTDVSGNAWDVETRKVQDENTLLELLNSVICYYADNYTYADGRSDNALGVASLLGVCDVDTGKSLVSTNQDIWKNIDTVANDMLPILGVLQGRDSGDFNSEDLIWNDVVLGILDINRTDIHESGLGGVSNFLYRLIKIVSSSPIQSERIVDVAYELVKELINGLLGPRYTGQEWYPIPDATSTHPFDDLLQKTTLAGTGSSDVGAVQKAINNVVEFTGYGYNGMNTYPDSILAGCAFVANAVNSFITILPDLKDHSLTLASAEFENDVVSNAKSGVSNTEKAYFTNECQGVNIAYVDGIDGDTKQISRYYVKITNLAIVNVSTGNVEGATITSDTSGLIAPGDSATLTINDSLVSTGGQDNCTYKITVTYSIVQKDGTVLQSGLVARAYQYLTSASDWETSVYPYDEDPNNIRIYSDGTTLEFRESLESNSPTTNSYNDFKVITSSYFGDTSSNNKFVVSYPEYVVLTTDDLSAVDNYGIRVRNAKTGGLTGASKTYYGMYYYEDTQTVTDTGVNGTSSNSVTIGQANAIPVFDKTTGDLLRYGLYDITYDGGQTWDRTGYTIDEVNDKEGELDDSARELFDSRTHVAYTLAEAYNMGIIAASYKNDRGTYDYVYMQSSTNYAYQKTLINVSVRGPIDGFYFNNEDGVNCNVSIGSNNSNYYTFLKYDGSTDVQGTKEIVDSNICFYHNVTCCYVPFKFAIADTSSTSKVESKYNELMSILNNYKDSDFTSTDAVDTATAAAESALATIATPITPTSATTLTDTTSRQPVTSQTTNALGDVAYKPYGSGDESKIPTSILQNAYFDDDTQLYYYDSDFVAPIYSTTALTAKDVDKKGNDPAGYPVTYNEETGLYYHTNSVVYETEWDTTTFQGSPWNKETSTQATNSSGYELYEQIQFKHYNANGKEVRDADQWVVAIPQTSYQLVANTTETDNRGLYTKANDYLDYAIDIIYDSIKSTIAEPLLTEVSEVRQGMNSVNFDVLTYNKMVSLAQKIESNYTIDVTYTTAKTYNNAYVRDDEGNIVYNTTQKTATVNYTKYARTYLDNDDYNVISTKVNSTLSSIQVEEYTRLFNFFMDKVVERGYQGTQLEAEILHASGAAYKAYTVTNAEYDNEGNITSEAIVRSTTATPAFGTYVGGKLVNQNADGTQAYTDETWSEYVAALANAVSIAKTGNGSYAHKKEAYYVATANDYTAQVTDCYSADTRLQKAEIALTAYEEPVVPTGHTVSANIVVATKSTGATAGTPVYGEYTLDVYSDSARTQLVTTATSVYDANNLVNTVTATLDDGTYYATLTSEYSLERKDITIIVNGEDIIDAQVPVVACDMDKDGYITSDDAKKVYVASSTGTLKEYCDFDGDGYATADDAKIVYVMSSNSTLPAITIQ